jgi:hypothetical protein
MLTNAYTQMFVTGSAPAAPVAPWRNSVAKTLRFGNVLALAGRCAR